MNISYIIGGLMGAGLLGGLLLTSASSPEMPDRGFNYALAAPQDKVDWLTEYGHFIHHVLEENKRSDATQFKFVSVDPSIRGVSIQSIRKNGPDIDQATLKSDEFQAKLAEQATAYQAKYCKRDLAKAKFVDDSKVMLTFVVGNVVIPDVELSQVVCAEIVKKNTVNKLFGQFKN